MKKFTSLVGIALLLVTLLLSHNIWQQRQQINDLYERDMTILEVMQSLNHYQDSVLLLKIDEMETYIINRIDEIPEINLTDLEKQIKINHSLAFENTEDIHRHNKWWHERFESEKIK